MDSATAITDEVYTRSRDATAERHAIIEFLLRRARKLEGTASDDKVLLIEDLAHDIVRGVHVKE